MNNLTNYHSHCDFCDGHAPMELFVREAVKEGFSSYGISSHAPFPVQNGCNMQKEKMTAYLEEFRRLKRLYSSEIDLYIGLRRFVQSFYRLFSIPSSRLSYRVCTLYRCARRYACRYRWITGTISELCGYVFRWRC